MNKIYMQCGGGLGDCLNTFFIGNLTYAAAIKEKAPDTQIHVLCTTSNSSILDIFQHHPAFDSASTVSCLGDATREAIAILEADGYKQWSSVFDINTLTRSRQKVYLTIEEEKAVTEITTLDKFIVVHPFNSAGTGITATHYAVNTDYAHIIRQMLTAGYYVVQVGGNWTHIPSNNRQTEDYQFDHPKFINLVNKFNVRMTARLIMNAHKFLGTSSAWVVVAAVNGIPSFMILPDQMKDILKYEQETGDGLRGTLIKSCGLFSGASIPELYGLTEEFLKANLQRKTPDFINGFSLL